MSLLEVCQAIQASTVGTGVRESAYLFPIIEGTHVLGLSLSVGTVMWFDLRLLGKIMRHIPVSEVFHQLRPWMFTGFAVMLTSGSLLFSAVAADAYANTYFRMKVVLLFMAAANTLLFHSTIDRRRSEWDKAPLPPLQARAAGLLSLVLWMGVIIAGRLFAYAV
jgi:Family of unknown function (DUF6644)